MIDYIKLLGETSNTTYQDAIIKMLDYYGVYGLRELTEEQIQNYVLTKIKDNKTNDNI